MLDLEEESNWLIRGALEANSEIDQSVSNFADENSIVDIVFEIIFAQDCRLHHSDVRYLLQESKLTLRDRYEGTHQQETHF